MAHDIKEHDIPKELVVNTDHAQGVLAQGSNFTWAKTGSKQISIVGAEEKQAITIVTSISSRGVLLPFQAVYEGNQQFHALNNQKIVTPKQPTQAFG